MRATPDLAETPTADYYRRMLLIRRFEEASSRQYMQRKIGGFLHLYIGQEAVAVGAISALNEADYVVSHYRDHGHALARGMDPNAVMAELYGKATGSSAGRGGSMHLFDVSRNFMGGYGIVGGQLPIAVGLALACKLKAEDRVVLCFFGDGAVNQGIFHESMNLASLWKLPILFFLENNLYGMGTRVEQSHAGGKDIYTRAESYQIPAVQIDGMDLTEVHQTTAEALTRVRSGAGPAFLEAMTYKLRGHSVADPSTYRESSEVDDWKTRDPIDSFREASIQSGAITQEQVDLIEQEVTTQVEEALRFAEESPDPDVATLEDNVYG
jgi:pyruvate dehydrogenase E1 component alpha subunit